MIKDKHFKSFSLEWYSYYIVFGIIPVVNEAIAILLFRMILDNQGFNLLRGIRLQLKGHNINSY